MYIHCTCMHISVVVSCSGSSVHDSRIIATDRVLCDPPNCDRPRRAGDVTQEEAQGRKVTLLFSLPSCLSPSPPLLSLFLLHPSLFPPSLSPSPSLLPSAPPPPLPPSLSPYIAEDYTVTLSSKTSHHLVSILLHSGTY